MPAYCSSILDELGFYPVTIKAGKIILDKVKIEMIEYLAPRTYSGFKAIS